MTSPDTLTIAEDEHDTLAWVLTDLDNLAAVDAPGADAVSAPARAAWASSVFTRATSHGGTVTLPLPASTADRRSLADVLRRLAERTRPNSHPTGLVYWTTSRATAALAERIAPAALGATG